MDSFGAYVFVYLGMAVSTNIYWYFHLRTITKLRACLVTAISRHTSAVNIHLLEDPQSPLTLMSNDVERTVQGIRYLHEVWANAVQACLATYILERQAGAACVVSVGITVLASAAVVYITSTIGSKQHKWMEAIQKRTAAISDLLSSIKGVKMKGLEDRFYNIIDSLRSQDIKCGNKFRMVMTYTAGLSFVPEFLCPFLPFIVLVLAPNISGSTFDATKIFTILSALLVLTQPLTNGFQILPAVLAGVGSLKRIGTFLLADEQLECRRIEKKVVRPSFESNPSEKDGRSIEKPQPVGVEVGSKDSHSHSKSPVFQIAAGAFHWGNKADAISNVNIPSRAPC
jgi:ATP-binding cassette subfamily C (CFTR/MRP) protein 1